MTVRDLPREYVEYVRRGNAIEASLTCDPGYMILWPLDDVANLNDGYEVPKYAPGFVCFGSSGGGELLAFDAAGAVYSLPAIGMDAKAAIRIADSWAEFEQRIENA